MMRKWVLVPIFLIFVSCLPWLVQAQSADKPDSAAISQRAQELRDAIQDLVMDHDSTLEVQEARYTHADTNTRTAIKAEGQALELQFQQKYLTMMVEYGRLTGDDDAAEDAQEQLDFLAKNGELSQPLKITPKTASK